VRKINKKWVAVIVLVLIVGTTILSLDKIRDYYVKSKLEPQTELLKASQNMAAAKSYRYSLSSDFTVEGRKEVISRVAGEKDEGNTHIKGEMVNTPVDIYYIDRIIYNYDSFSKHWLEIDSGTDKAEELFISELNPLSNFRFKEINNVEKSGFEFVDGAECLVVKCKPTVESQLLETLWKDFEYRFWIDYREGFIKKASLNAVNKKMPKTVLHISVGFKDLNKKIEIKAPDTSKKN